jgi:hypothetical protein
MERDAIVRAERELLRGGRREGVVTRDGTKHKSTRVVPAKEKCKT